jgi:hypothetical protein
MQAPSNARQTVENYQTFSSSAARVVFMALTSDGTDCAEIGGVERWPRACGQSSVTKKTDPDNSAA